MNRLIDIIVANKLRMVFGDLTAVNNIDISVKEGEIYGFLGPNGAGKTTTMRMLTTLQLPTSGDIYIGGFHLPNEKEDARKLIGMVQQHISLDKDLSVLENMKYHSILHKIPRRDAERRIKELYEYINLEPYLNKTIAELSGGWKRKVAIICSIIHKPKILFLDEPTAGLDTQSRHMLWELIRKLNTEGTTIFLTTHYIEEAEALCDRVGIIRCGKMAVLGSPQELCDIIGRMAVEYEIEGKRVYRYFPDRASSKEFAEKLDADYLIRKTSLEDVFLELTGRDSLTAYGDFDV